MDDFSARENRLRGEWANCAPGKKWKNLNLECSDGGEEINRAKLHGHQISKLD